MLSKVSMCDAESSSWEYLQSFLPSGWEENCRQAHAMVRTREFADAGALLRTLLIHLLDGCSLRETAVRARHAHIADVSDVALLKRLNKAGEWFRWMAQRVVETWAVAPATAGGVRPKRTVRLVDATHVSEPGSTGADWRIHYAFDLPLLRCAEVMVTDYRRGESLRNFTVQRDCLYVADRGYYESEGIARVVAGGGHVLVRMRTRAMTLYASRGKPFDLFKHLRRLQGRQIGDWDVAFAAGSRQVHGRVCALRKSDVAAQRALEKLHRRCKRKGTTPRHDALEAAKYVFVFTTLPREELAAVTALDLYRDRWQVELVFKRLKSILALGHLPKQDPHGARAWIHGKLFCAALVEALTHAAVRFSPWGYPLPAPNPAT